MDTIDSRNSLFYVYEGSFWSFLSLWYLASILLTLVAFNHATLDLSLKKGFIEPLGIA